MPVATADLSVEAKLFERGMGLIAGMDEVGRGPIAGPVSVGVAVIDADASLSIEGLIDSKALTEKKRHAMVPLIEQWCSSAVGHASPAEIDALGITVALRLAGQRALAQVAARGFYPDAVLLDGKHDWLTPAQTDLFAELDPAAALYRDLAAEAWAVAGVHYECWSGAVQMEIKGDYRCASIAAASVVAKVERDELMKKLDVDYPSYGWAKNKGYGSAAHRAALTDEGPSTHHRLSWALPVSAEQLQKAYLARESQ
ncbi:ribonuclease HII [Mycobacteroides abscessus subsp. bolletii]|nr:ribonuclease HII [Mycobacteroides abscessus subsp. bolletii]